MVALVLIACRQPRQPDAGADGVAAARAGAARRARRRHAALIRLQVVETLLLAAAGGGRRRRAWAWSLPALLALDPRWPAPSATSSWIGVSSWQRRRWTLTRGARGGRGAAAARASRRSGRRHRRRQPARGRVAARSSHAGDAGRRRMRAGGGAARLRRAALERRSPHLAVAPGLRSRRRARRAVAAVGHGVSDRGGAGRSDHARPRTACAPFPASTSAGTTLNRFVPGFFLVTRVHIEGSRRPMARRTSCSSGAAAPATSTRCGFRS